MKSIIPHKATHPGTILKDELEARNIKQKDFALSIDSSNTVLNEIIKGKRNITPDTALLIENELSISAEYWMRFQTQYDIDIARIKEKNVSKIKRTEEWKIIKEYVNISYLKKRNLLNDSLEDCISMVKNIFVFNTIDELIQNYSSYKDRYALYKKSEKLKIDEKNLFTWEMVCKKLVKSKSVGIYSNEKIESLKSELNVLFYENNNVLSKTESLLNKFGIKFLVQEKLDKTPVDGVTFWSENNPTIVVTLRKKNLDNFAFTIMHELGHIAMHLDTDRATTILDIENINEENVREIEADGFAQKSLINTEVWESIKRDLQTDYKIKEYSKQYKIHPSILLGRKCWEEKKYNIYTSIDKTIH